MRKRKVKLGRPLLDTEPLVKRWFRCSAKQWRAYGRLAKRRGLSISGWLRLIADREIEREKKQRS